MSDKEGPTEYIHQRTVNHCTGCSHMKFTQKYDWLEVYDCLHPKWGKGIKPGRFIGNDDITPSWCPIIHK